MKKDRACGIILVRKEEREFLYLLVQSVKGYWGFPKGHQNLGESDLETARRELWEETGIKDIELTDKKIICDYVGFDGNERFEKDVVFFLAFALDTNIKIPAEFEHEIKEIKWATYDEAKKFFDFPATQNVLNKANGYLLANF